MRTNKYVEWMCMEWRREILCHYICSMYCTPMLYYKPTQGQIQDFGRGVGSRAGSGIFCVHSTLQPRRVEGHTPTGNLKFGYCVIESGAI